MSCCILTGVYLFGDVRLLSMRIRIYNQGVYVFYIISIYVLCYVSILYLVQEYLVV